KDRLVDLRRAPRESRQQLAAKFLRPALGRSDPAARHGELAGALRGRDPALLTAVAIAPSHRVALVAARSQRQAQLLFEHTLHRFQHPPPKQLPNVQPERDDLISANFSHGVTSSARERGSVWVNRRLRHLTIS